jgi:hypothetical protein
MSESLSFDDRLKLAGQLVGRARIFFDVWWFYEGDQTRPAILDAMNEYPEFFRYDSHAHFVAFVVHLAGLLETRSDTVNLEALISEATATNALPGTLTSQTEPVLVGLKPLRRAVMILRSNLFAHRSSSMSYAEAFKTAAVTPNELRRGTESLLSLVNLLLRSRGLPEQSFNEASQRHLREMLNAIEKTRAT